MKKYIQNIYHDGIRSILNSKDNNSEKYYLLYDITLLLLSQITNELNHPSVEIKLNHYVQFTHVCNHYNLPNKLRFAWFKILYDHRSTHQLNDEKMETVFNNLLWTSIHIYQHLSNNTFNIKLDRSLDEPDEAFWSPRPSAPSIPLAQVVLFAKKSETQLSYHGYWIDRYGEEIVVRPSLLMETNNQVKALKLMDVEVYLPINTHLINCSHVENELHPSAIVFSPDHLIDITAIAKCFTPFGELITNYFIGKIQRYRPSVHLLIGNAVNMMLDELIYDADQSFETLCKNLFAINEMAWTAYNDDETRSILETIHQHYLHLKGAIVEEFPRYGIDPQYCIVEPSFFSPQYGLQGRLDLLYEHPQFPNQKVIVELKSGKTFRPNSYGLNHPHYIQTLLYDLLVQSADETDLSATNYIMYSAEEKDILRHAPVIKNWQYEALGIRNNIIILEWQLAQWTKNKRNLYEVLQGLDEHLVGFTARDRSDFYQSYENCSTVQRKYFDAFFTFVTREQILSKLGQVSEDRQGQSSLWTQSWKSKDRQYNLLADLVVEEDDSRQANPLVKFKKSANTHPLANFRVGDIILTYPSSRKENPHRGQVYRCTLLEIDEDSITIRLRARQYHPIFRKGSQWQIERDQLDSSFHSMYQSLAEILAIDPQHSEVILGLRQPQPSRWIQPYTYNDKMTSIQNEILEQMLNSGDYYLLWGPPGTGKTSVMLHQYAAIRTRSSKTRLLILGYTNRAVDEICESLLQIPHIQKDQITRIGSMYGTHPRFRSLLLREKTTQIKNRISLKNLLENTKIVCGTITSISGKPELFDLIRFDQIIIDEASQILEPGLIGLLCKNIPYILIGDHKQLPAVVIQSESDSMVVDKELNKIDLRYLTNSYFERLYSLNLKNKWHHSLGVLKHQGRMHQILMDFPNQQFYNGILEILPFNNDHQCQPLPELPSTHENDITQILLHRNVFIPTIEKNADHPKINKEEAQKCLAILTFLHSEQPDIDWRQVGIITPYRAQIAQITHALNEAKFQAEGLTIDTVERYQGGAKNIIIISYCVNSLSQLHMLNQSITSEGIDRKLNVALTRARHQIIFLGNKELLIQNQMYRQLVEQYFEIEL
ncbi:DEAD/DEAH box helicase [Membranihabitans marinus]|uniref:DEAD/DEAH box helicase n=1 Tax=Membranihabitans marinus TaxID=1227546 RepID=UPI001F36BA63|nr:AAA domain-containing protein [Membranihabitans marinus]